MSTAAWRPAVLRWVWHPLLHVLVVGVLAAWVLAPLRDYLDLPNHDQLAYLTWAREGRLHRKAPLYVADIRALSELSGAEGVSLFFLERRVTIALACASTYLAVRSIASPVTALVVALDVLGLRYVLEETNGSHLFAVALYCLALAALGWLGRRGVPLSLGLLVLSALARRELWLIVVPAAAVLLPWYARGPRPGSRWRALLVWGPASILFGLAAVLVWRQTGDAQPWALVLQVSMVANLLESLKPLMPALAPYDMWTDPRVTVPALFAPDVTGVLEILRRYPDVFAMHVALNVLHAPRSILALFVKHPSWSSFGAFWALALAARFAEAMSRPAGTEPRDTRSGAARWPVYVLAALGVVPFGFLLVTIKLALRFVLVLLPLAAVALARVVEDGPAALTRRLRGTLPAAPAWLPALLALALILVYAWIPLGPLRGLPRGHQPNRAVVEAVAGLIPPGGGLGSDVAGLVCYFGPRCRPRSFGLALMRDPAQWNALGVDRVFLTAGALSRLRALEGTEAISSRPAAAGWQVVHEGVEGVLWRRDAE